MGSCEEEAAKARTESAQPREKKTRRGRRPTRSTEATATRVPGTWQATEENRAAYERCGSNPLA
jgi:hypothetical protein